MYSLSNTPSGYFEENNQNTWEKTFPQNVMRTMRVYFGDNADAYYDEIIRAGLEGRNCGFTTSPMYRWVSV